MSMFFDSGGGTFRFKFQIDWRRGPKELRVALKKLRSRALREIAKSVRANAPHPSIAQSVRVSASQVRIDHPAAAVFEFGAKPHFPPLGPIREWAISVGKDPDSAFPVARAISRRGLPEQPYIRPAIESAMTRVPQWLREIWEGGR